MGQWRQADTEAQKFRRVSTHVPVRVSTVDPEPDPDSGELFYRSAEETTANLSRGGAFVHSWEPLAAGRRVVIEIELPEGPRLQLVGRVVWTRRQLVPSEPIEQAEPGYGIEFQGSSRDELASLDRYLDRITPSEATSHTPDAPSPPSGP